MLTGGDTIFGKIIRREIPADIVYETDKVLAFRDIQPQAPTHILVIPKTHLRDLTDANTNDRELLGELLLAVAHIAKSAGLTESGYRVVINNGAGAGQSVFHLHLHILGKRKFAWPPG
ncbi:MAG: histidine triad nucleotide-binding protein [Oligoflexia bacterium]|nr:histidine triad nucleotide-binding protein [Oligoflexia bacterium]